MNDTVAKTGFEALPKAVRAKLTKLADQKEKKFLQGKRCYDKARESMNDILAILKANDIPLDGAEIPMSAPDTVFVISDQFAEKNVVWKPAGVERFVGEAKAKV